MEILSRENVKRDDTWDLSSFYPSISAWEADFQQAQQKVPELQQYVGHLGESAQKLKAAFECYLSTSRLLDKVYTYTHLLSDEDTSNSVNLGYLQRAQSLFAQFGAVASFISPELLTIKPEQLEKLLSDPQLKDYRRIIQDIVRYREHTLSQAEEILLARSAEALSASERIFSQLNNADLRFGSLNVDGEERALTHGSFSVFLKHENRAVREKAYRQFYAEFEQHKNTIAATLSGSVQRDVFFGRVKNFNSSLERSLFFDDVKPHIYENLLHTVGSNLAPLHRYYDLRRKLMKLDRLQMFDTYVPLVPNIKVEHSYERACELILEALVPLGTDYIETLRKGLGQGRWVDRYENRGKRSGAYSSGCYDSVPYILMNYKSDHLHDVFTLAHEAGHSMHTNYSKSQLYQDSSYTIFVAEVASTFNEQLLMKHLREVYADNQQMLMYLINQQLDDIKATFFRQLMFAEFEKITHELAEAYQPLTVDVFCSHYRRLLEKFFGKAVTIEELDTLECLRIPHFYSAFYVYKYATGLAASISLSQQVLAGGAATRDRYLNFLKSGASKYPLELLKDAGVDLSTKAPIEATLNLFSQLLDQFEATL